MCDVTDRFKNLRYNSPLRHFIRERVKWVKRKGNNNGGRYSSRRIEEEIHRAYQDGLAPGLVTHATIDRFVDEKARLTSGAYRRYEIGSSTLAPLAWFLTDMGVVTFEELEGHDKGHTQSMALALSAYFQQARINEEPIRETVLGTYRHYGWVGTRLLEETSIDVSSADEGQSLSVVVAHIQYTIKDPSFLKEETNDLDPSFFSTLATNLDLDGNGDSREGQVVQHGSIIWSDDVIAILLPGTESHKDRILVGNEVIYGEDHVKAFRLSENTIYSRNQPPNIVVGQSTRENPALSGSFSFYNTIEEIDTLLDERYVFYHDLINKRTMHFSDAQSLDMTKEEFDLVTIQNREIEIESIMADCADATEKLAQAISFRRSDYGREAIAEGADLSSTHPNLNLPMLHAMASLGMGPLIKSALASGRCDPAQKDAWGRMASTHAEVSAEDSDLADLLIEAQAQAEEALGADPEP